MSKANQTTKRATQAKDFGMKLRSGRIINQSKESFSDSQTFGRDTPKKEYEEFFDCIKFDRDPHFWIRSDDYIALDDKVIDSYKRIDLV